MSDFANYYFIFLINGRKVKFTAIFGVRALRCKERVMLTKIDTS
jgi:hypothetical protein